MWFFQELDFDYFAIFSSEEEADKFVKAYGIKMYNDYGRFPIDNRDYVLKFCEIDPDISVLDKIFKE
jgi:hypothetical protein